MKTRVLIQNPISAEAEQCLLDKGFEISRGSGSNKAAFMAELQNCDAVVVKKVSGFTIDREVIDAAQRVKVFARFGVGVEIIDVDYAQQNGIIVTNSPKSNSNAVAEHTMYLILACAKNSRRLSERIFSGQFNAGVPEFAMELEGATLGIIGCKRIGCMVAKKAKYGFGMKVIGYDPFVSEDRFSKDIERRDSLELLMAEADIISVHMNAMPETIHMISEAQLKLMKPAAFIINTARGELIDQKALYEVLKEKRIAGAGLDVFEHEPLPADDAFTALDNVILTPHYAAFTKNAIDKASMDVAQDIIAVLNGDCTTREVTKLGTSPKL